MTLRFVTSGESHGPSLCVIVDGLPAGIPLDKARIQADLRRRQGGHGRGGRMLIESDTVEITSGVRHGQTLGSPVGLTIRNQDHENWKDVMSPEPQPPEAKARRALKFPRPGHADLAGALKYRTTDLRNVLERASARETAARVAAGGVARQLLECLGIEVASHVVQIGSASAADEPVPWEALSGAEASPVRCVDGAASEAMVREIDTVKRAGDTVGGVFEVVVRGVPPGLGSFAQWDRRLDGRLAQALMSIPAVKAVAVGTGFEAAQLPGSRFHDEILFTRERGVHRATNRAGGIEGGVSNGEELRLRAAVKPIPTMMTPLRSIDLGTKEAVNASYERSDTCVVPAAGVVGEAMTALVIADAALEKFGGDSLGELLAHVEASRAQWQEILATRADPPRGA